MIRITVDWKGNKGFDNLIRYIQNNALYGEAQEKVRVLGHHTADSMRETINYERKRTGASHKLDNAITAETLNTVGGIEVGIGNIGRLNQEAPYWEMINDGATYVTKKEHIVPFEDGEYRIYKVGSSHFIQGIDYVGKAIRQLDLELKEKMAEWGVKFIVGMEKSSK